MIEFAVLGQPAGLNMSRNGYPNDHAGHPQRLHFHRPGFSPPTASSADPNRNFRPYQTPNDNAYLVGPETAVASAVMGEMRSRSPEPPSAPTAEIARHLPVDDSMIEKPSMQPRPKAQVLRGPTIVSGAPTPSRAQPTAGSSSSAATRLLPTTSCLPASSSLPNAQYAKVVFNCFNKPDQPTFAERALDLKAQGIAGVVVASLSYGQGSSREHAALCPMYLGVRAVIARSIERIHKANLINFAIVPLEFVDEADYERIQPDDQLHIENLLDAIRTKDRVTVADTTAGFTFECRLDLSPRDRDILLAAGLLNYTRRKALHG